MELTILELTLLINDVDATYDSLRETSCSSLREIRKELLEKLRAELKLKNEKNGVLPL